MSFGTTFQNQISGGSLLSVWRRAQNRNGPPGARGNLCTQSMSALVASLAVVGCRRSPAVQHLTTLPPQCHQTYGRSKKQKRKEQGSVRDEMCGIPSSNRGRNRETDGIRRALDWRNARRIVNLSISLRNAYIRFYYYWALHSCAGSCSIKL